MKFNFFKKHQVPRSMRTSLAPRREFLSAGKTRFLAAFDAHFGLRPAPFFQVTVLVRAFAVVLVLVGTATGVSAYADSKNVSADNMLYPFKRFGENLQLTLAADSEKPKLQALFANRRLDEITELQATNAADPLVSNLTQDLGNSIAGSLDGAQAAGLEDGDLDNVCEQLLTITDASSTAALQDALIADPQLLDRIGEKCGNASSEDHGDGERHGRGRGREDGGNIIIPPSTATSTVSTSTTSTDVFFPGRDGSDRERSRGNDRNEDDNAGGGEDVPTFMAPDPTSTATSTTGTVLGATTQSDDNGGGGKTETSGGTGNTNGGGDHKDSGDHKDGGDR